MATNTLSMMNYEHLRQEIVDQLNLYDVRPDMQRPLADVLLAMAAGHAKDAVDEALTDLQNHPEAVSRKWAEGWKTEVLSNMFPHWR